MLSRRNVIENHLKKAQDAVAGRVKVLEGKKFDRKRQKRDPHLRSLQAEVRKYADRLKALDQIAAVNADVEARRAERLAKPKEPKVKKKKPVEAKAPKVKKERKAPAAEG
jgi:hypothetical protein